MQPHCTRTLTFVTFTTLGVLSLKTWIVSSSSAVSPTLAGSLSSFRSRGGACTGQGSRSEHAGDDPKGNVGREREATKGDVGQAGEQMGRRRVSVGCSTEKHQVRYSIFYLPGLGYTIILVAVVFIAASLSLTH